MTVYTSVMEKFDGMKDWMRIAIGVKMLWVSRSSEAILKELSSPIMEFLLLAFPGALITAKEEAIFLNEHIEIYHESGEQRFTLGWKPTGTDFSSKWIKKFIPKVSIELGEGVAITRIRTDAFDGKISPADTVIMPGILRSSTYPLEGSDKIAFFPSREIANTFISDTKITSFDAGGCAPNTYNTWGDKTSDENLSRFFFHAIGAMLLELQTGPSSKPELGSIEIDLSFMTDYAVREGFRPYGATLYFDSDQKATAIFDAHKKTLVKPGDDAWEETKFLARSSALALCNIRKHLLETHLTAANCLSTSSIKNLPPNHEIRRLLNVFTFNSNRVNDNAMAILITQRGLLHRFTAFDAIDEVFRDGFEANNVFEPFPDRPLRPELLAQSKAGKLPYHKDGCEYYDIVKKLATAWLDEAGSSATDEYAKDFYNTIKEETKGTKYVLPVFCKGALIDLICQGMFAVTAWHEVAGNLIDYTNDPWFAGGRVVDGATSMDVQGFTIALLVTAATGGTVPRLMTKYENYFGKDGAPAWERKHWDVFYSDLQKQSEKVGNESRTPEYKFMDPKNFESSVSV